MSEVGEVKLYQKSIKCGCGSRAKLKYVATIGPIYGCGHCGTATVDETQLTKGEVKE